MPEPSLGSQSVWGTGASDAGTPGTAERRLADNTCISVPIVTEPGRVGEPRVVVPLDALLQVGGVASTRCKFKSPALSVALALSQAASARGPVTVPA